ncbi:MAG: hypothetical protein JWQ09_1781 [Segetibacter sp.]|nr:hypothetical protein [Segetibacter sp.]
MKDKKQAFKDLQYSLLSYKPGSFKWYMKLFWVAFKVATEKEKKGEEKPAVLDVEKTIGWVKFFFSNKDRNGLVTIENLRHELETYISESNWTLHKIPVHVIIDALSKAGFQFYSTPGEAPQVAVNDHDYKTLLGINNISCDKAMEDLLLADSSTMETIQRQKKLFIEMPENERNNYKNTGFGLSLVKEFEVNKTVFVMSWIGYALAIRAKHLITATSN